MRQLNMQPLIKWPGGKRQEFEKIENAIPLFERYVEPFFGGGAVFFALEPKQSAINDLSVELMNFYKCISNKELRINFKKEMYQLLDHWEKISEYTHLFEDDFINLYNEHRNNKLTEIEFGKKLTELFENKIMEFNGLFSEEFCVYPVKLAKQIEKSVFHKLVRTKNKVDINNNFDKNEVLKNVETAFRSGFYTHLRSLYNKSQKEQILSMEKQTAIFYFIREFCYASMFRYNSNGEFNIPYGGYAYNNKDFRKKIDDLFSEKVLNLLENAQIRNVDFEKFLQEMNLTERDFLFLDPPYDTEFNNYAKNVFGKEDQKRLADVLYKTKAKFILIIKETDFIKQLYSSNENNIKVSSFEKTYMYNVKGRNERDVNHLVIMNF